MTTLAFLTVFLDKYEIRNKIPIPVSIACKRLRYWVVSNESNVSFRGDQDYFLSKKARAAKYGDASIWRLDKLVLPIILKFLLISFRWRNVAPWYVLQERSIQAFGA